ncbi:MAG TPA: hypothetical protein VMF59_14095, partial [Bacteroidota bacterium]|nr:hypothetical protein [Bacteroidota bacterium]
MIYISRTAMHACCSAVAILLLIIPRLLLSSPRQGAGPGDREFSGFVSRVAAIPDSAGRSRAVDSLVRQVQAEGRVPGDDSTLTIMYRGKARRVFFAGDINDWEPSSEELSRLTGTDLFYRSWRLDPAARVEYKLVVDSVWMTDPLNPHRAPGGFGENSEIRMPRYRAPAEAVKGDAPEGSFDTLSFARSGTGGRLPVRVYLPAGYISGTARYPVLYVTDGGEYLSLAGM